MKGKTEERATEIVVEQLEKEYDLHTMGLEGVSLRAADGGFLTVVGAAGCGKTTLLFCIGGLVDATAGRVLFGGKDMTNADPRDRDVCLMRDNGIACRGSIYDNISYGLRLRGLPKREIDARVCAAAEVLGLSDRLHDKIGKASALDRRRTSVARALARKPAVFLLDEPLFDLPDEDRLTLAADIAHAQRTSGLTFIAASSAGEDAFLFGGDVAVMKDGRVVQTGTEEELTSSPSDMFVASFVGGEPMQFVRTADGFLGFRAGDAVIGEGTLEGVAEAAGNGEIAVRLSPEDPPVRVRSEAAVAAGETVRLKLTRSMRFDCDGKSLTKYLI